MQAAAPILLNVHVRKYQSIRQGIAQGHHQCVSQAGTSERVDLKRNVQSIDPNSVGLWFLILWPDFS